MAQPERPVARRTSANAGRASEASSDRDARVVDVRRAFAHGRLKKTKTLDRHERCLTRVTIAHAITAEASPGGSPNELLRCGCFAATTYDGAAPESNRPSRGLHDRTVFEDLLCW
jgi:hypothetical protein